MKKSRYIALICGGVSIVVTVMFYLMTFDNIFMAPMRWISLLFLIISEVIFIIKAFNLKKAIFALSGIVTSCLHIALVLTMSIVFVDILPLFIKQYVLLNSPARLPAASACLWRGPSWRRCACWLPPRPSPFPAARAAHGRPERSRWWCRTWR